MTPNPSSPPSDQALLAAYVAKRKGDAFSEMVARYVDVVYAAALRQVRDPHLAEDVVQAVFIVLSKRAGSIPASTPLAGWFLLTTRNVARNALKHEWRLKRREKKAAEMRREPEEAPLSPENESIAGALDEAMAQLSEDDRNVIVQRFFNAQSHRQVGAILGVSEEAASKRLSRAIQRLREMLARQGVTASEAALGAALPVIAIKTAPPALVGAINAAQIGAAPAAAMALAKTGGVSMWGIAASMVLLFGAGAIIAVTLLQNLPTAPPTAPPAAAPAPNRRTVTITILDNKTKGPLPNATVETAAGNAFAPAGTSDAQGHVDVTLPQNFDNLRVRIRAAGRVGVETTWSNQVFRGQLPPELTFSLEEGTPVSGVVVDEAGNPLANANVRFYVVLDGNYEYSIPEIAPRNLTTDEQGRFTLPNAPADLKDVRVEFKHPTAGDNDGMSMPLARGPDGGVMRYTLKKLTGEAVEGVVLDPNGKPLADAKVVVAEDRYESNKPTANTDAEGHFKISGLREFSRVLTVTARGYAPQLVDFKAGASKPLTVQMENPSKLEGVVVRENGTPVVGAQVSIEQWRNHRALQWSTRTDAQGRFVWNEAPGDEVKVNVSLRNFSEVDALPIKPGGEPAKIVMYPVQSITGSVTDAVTNKAIPKFIMTYGIRWTGQQDVTWQTSSSRTLANGKYDANISSFYNGGKIRVEADGYLPATSEMIYAKDGALQLDFALQPGTGPSGLLVDADGAAMADAVVYEVPLDAYFNASDDNGQRLEAYQGIKKTKTDKNGMFTLPPPETEVNLLVMHEKGFAFVPEVEFTAAEHRLTLRKWGRVEGTLRLNTKAAAGVRVRAAVRLSERVGAEVERAATTDDNGRFVLERIPPGTVMVNRIADLGGGSSAYIYFAQFELKSGEVHELEVGGVGRPVVATVVAPVDLEISGQTLDVSAEPAEVSTEVPYPDNFLDLAPEAQGKWISDYLQAHGNAAKVDPAMRQFRFIPGKDNTIRAEDVAPGRYRMRLSMHTPWTGREISNVAWGVSEFTVNADRPLPSEEPLDLGKIQLTKGTERPQPAHQQITTADGEPFDQSMIKDKIVIIHNWSLGHYEQVPALQRLAEKYKDNPKVMIVNAAMVPRPQWAKEIAARQKIPGLQIIQPPPLERVLNQTPASLQLYVGDEKSAPTALDPATAESAVDEAIRKAG
jgi:RNA polymerase sigma factor (sigma-70 family)